MENMNIMLSRLTPLNDDRYISLKECLQYKALKKYEIPLCLGRDSNGEIQFRDFVDIGNLLISGMTSSGKSVFINSFINTVLLTRAPEEVKFILTDLKQVELHPYNGIAHLLHPVCEDGVKAIQLIEWCMEEIERRKTEKKKKPYIVIVIDEFSDLMLCDDKTNSKLEEIAKNSNEVGMFMLLSASVPRLEVFTPEIKNAIPKRLVGALATNSDSKEILEEGSAIDLLGHGDMIYKNVKSGERIRVQTPFISYEDQMIIIESTPKVGEYKEIELEEVEEAIDPLYEDAKRIAIENKKASASFLQRKLEISYNRAARLIDQLEKEKVIAPSKGVQPREVLMDKYESDGKEIIENRDPIFEDAKKVIQEYGKASVPLLQRKLKIGWNRAARLFKKLEEESAVREREKGTTKRKY